MRQDTAYFIILLCLIPNDFTRQMESAATQWVNDYFADLRMTFRQNVFHQDWFRKKFGVGNIEIEIWSFYFILLFFLNSATMN